MNEQTLLLNADFTIIKTIPWQTAMKLYFSDKVSIVDEYDRFIKHHTAKIKVPAVVALKKYYNLYKFYKVKFTSKNLYSRDDYICAYCGAQFSHVDLTKDHVIPRAHFKANKVNKPVKETSWENIVTACKTCNSKKGARTPAEANMQLLYKPYEPKSLKVIFKSKHIPEPWKAYINV